MDFKLLYEKYKDIIPYLFFGICTTFVNVITYWITAHLLKFNVMLSTIIAWLFAVLFAYITNRKWVFHSKFSKIFKEMFSFFMCRFATGVVDWLCMFICVNLFAWNDVFIKFLTNIIVIALNYLASKLVIFRREKNERSN